MARFDISHHAFTDKIADILQRHFGENAGEIFETSALLGYLNNKTKAANRGSKARGAFANHYAIYVVVEDYIKKGFHSGDAKTPYSKYAGARFSELLKRQRQLPFGTKLQNHALNGRLNDEFRKFYPSVGQPPIVREKQRYWIQEGLLAIPVRRKDGTKDVCNIAPAIIDIIDAYVASKRADFEDFLETCRRISDSGKNDPAQAMAFVLQQLQPNVDARVFEIVSYAVLKAKYGLETVWAGKTKAKGVEQPLVLYKTGRTNANDGGIDFVLKPLGRFFQVTETLDVGKYFLDIDKVQKFPITFVVKSTDTPAAALAAIRAQAVAKYKIEGVVDSYMRAIEEIITVDALVQAFQAVVAAGQLNQVMDEIAAQSRVEFNYEPDDAPPDGAPEGG